MTVEEALLQAILDARGDDRPRLVCADWLGENGRAERGDVIRVQCELARPALAPVRRRHLRARERELLNAHRREWLGRLRRSPLPWLFHRGFIERLGPGGVFRRGPHRY